MRCFVAITPPDEVAERLDALAQQIPLGRPTPRENLHLTLAFLGEIADSEARQMHESLCEIRQPPVRIELTGMDLFGGRKPEILLAAIRLSEPLSVLHRSVTGAARRAGITLRRQRFRPHITLARFNRPPSPDQAERLSAFLATRSPGAVGSFEADAFDLFLSELGSGPARHSALASYPLAG